MPHSFTREELYELVWSNPMSKLAKRLGVSDVGLAKACRRADIPLPGVGYWAKLQYGKKVQRILLPPSTPKTPALVHKPRPVELAELPRPRSAEENRWGVHRRVADCRSKDALKPSLAP